MVILRKIQGGAHILQAINSHLKLHMIHSHHRGNWSSSQSCLAYIIGSHKKYIGDIATWDKAESDLKEALDDFGKPWQEIPVYTVLLDLHSLDSFLNNFPDDGGMNVVVCSMTFSFLIILSWNSQLRMKSKLRDL
ncbi:hypothetical protein JHK87_000677 [Glycine soja]|nr:hypothetical protein JHK87_000677 [Glycine soja]